MELTFTLTLQFVNDLFKMQIEALLLINILDVEEVECEEIGVKFVLCIVCCVF